MSRGFGIVQRRLIIAFQENPDQRFTVEELAKFVYPNEPFQRKHEVAILRALKTIGNLAKCRVGRWGAKGWHYVFALHKD